MAVPASTIRFSECNARIYQSRGELPKLPGPGPCCQTFLIVLGNFALAPEIQAIYLPPPLQGWAQLQYVCAMIIHQCRYELLPILANF